MSGWIGVDLDGTLAHYDGWKGVDHIGEPIAPMVERVKGWLAAGKTVKIFTARMHGHGAPLVGGGTEDVVTPIEQWCLKHLGRKLEVTVKDFGMVELWDDRAVQVVSKNSTHTNGAVVASNGTKPKQLGGVTGKGFLPGKSGNPSGGHMLKKTHQFGELCRDWLFDQEWVKDLQGRKLHKQMRLKTVMQRLAEQKPEVLLHYAFGKPVEMVQLTQADGAPIEFVVKVRGEDLP